LQREGKRPVTRFVVQIDMDIEADSIEYLEERSAELEEIVSSHFDEGELVAFGVDVFEATADEDEDDDDGCDDEEYGTYDDDESEVDDKDR
jgi:hypothetical protein